MYKYHCLNPISEVGLGQLDENYVVTGDVEEADAILVRSAKMHDMEFSKNLKAIARAGAGVNNIPLDRCADEGIVVFNTPGANANGVKELVIAGMPLSPVISLAVSTGYRSMKRTEISQRSQRRRKRPLQEPSRRVRNLA